MFQWTQNMYMHVKLRWLELKAPHFGWTEGIKNYGLYQMRFKLWLAKLVFRAFFEASFISFEMNIFMLHLHSAKRFLLFTEWALSMVLHPLPVARAFWWLFKVILGGITKSRLLVTLTYVTYMVAVISSSVQVSWRFYRLKVVLCDLVWYIWTYYKARKSSLCSLLFVCIDIIIDWMGFIIIICTFIGIYIRTPLIIISFLNTNTACVSYMDTIQTSNRSAT